MSAPAIPRRRQRWSGFEPIEEPVRELWRGACYIKDEMLHLKRVYQPASRTDGLRFLVERLWPRGIRKQDLRLDDWRKDAAPSAPLRAWFSHDPAKWEKFKQKYFAELDANPDAWQPILKSAARRTVTLLYSSHDGQHNNAVALRQYLERKLTRRRSASSRTTV